MSSTHIQFMKWSFPAFALIIGLLWYKRRRVDRADPGGTSALTAKENLSNGVSLKSKLQRKNTPSPTTSTPLCDSGIHNESLSLSISHQAINDSVCSPKKTSEMIDVPNRKTASQPISVPSVKSSDESEAWYKDESIPKMIEVQLGSNPKISNFDMIARSMSSIRLDNENDNDTEGKVVKIFHNISESNVITQETSEEAEKVEESNCLCSLPENKEQQMNEQPKEESKIQAQVLCERDSANHSPVSGVLEGSVTDEARSEGSTDSGKGGSIKEQVKDVVIPSIYEFYIPQNLVGRLIGRNGNFLQSVRDKAGVKIAVRRHPTLRDQKICVIEGPLEGINIALDIIRQRFPEKKYPTVTLEQILSIIVPEEIPLVPELMQLSLIEGVNNDVLLCNIVKPNRLFVQLPTHPTYPSLRILDANMTQFYDTTESPMVPDELTRGMFLVAKWYDRWVRVYVENPDPHGERNVVRLIDHGGYWAFRNSDMRKIRSDYLALPFQAIEVFLANIQPKDGEWKQEAYNVIGQMCSGIVGQAQIEGYINNNVYINFFLNIHKHGVISLADELVARGYAEPVPLESIVPEEGIIIAAS